MDEASALLALQVIAGIPVGMTVSSRVFKAGGAVGINYVFGCEALIYQLFQSAVYRGLSDAGSAGLEVLAHVARGDVGVLYRFQIIQENISLGCFLV